MLENFKKTHKEFWSDMKSYGAIYTFICIMLGFILGKII